MKVFLAALCGAALIGSVGTAVPPAAAAEVAIQPRNLERGPDVRTPHLEGHRVVDGDTRILVRGTSLSLLGSSGDGYVLVVSRRSGPRQVVRVEEGRKERVLLKSVKAGRPILSHGGKTFAVIPSYAQKTSIQIRSARDGSVLRSRRGFRGAPQIVDLNGGRLLVSSFERGARVWNWRKNTVTKVTDGFVYRADLATDRLALFTGDPTLDGCTVVATITDPQTQLWRSCDEAVRAISPDGERIITGPPPAEVNDLPEIAWERTVHGDELATYVASEELSVVGWETSTDLLLEVYSKKRGATVRCSEGQCERASDLHPTPSY